MLEGFGKLLVSCQNARYVFQVASGSVPCICRWKIRPMVEWMQPSPRLCESPVARQRQCHNAHEVFRDGVWTGYTS